MRIQRMAFIQNDSNTGTSQQLFLLRSGHDLELECRIVNQRGKVQGEPVRLAFTLNDKFANQLDKYNRNTFESYSAWRGVIASILGEGVIEDGWFVPEKAVLIGIVAIATFGEPVWQLEDNLSAIDANILNVVQVHQHENAR